MGPDAETRQRRAAVPSWEARVLPRPRSAREERAAEETKRIVAATLDLLGEVGAEFTVHHVTERARVSRRRFYQHFASKDDLLLTICATEATALVDKVAATLATVDDPLDRLRLALSWDDRTPPGSRSLRYRGLAACHHRLGALRPTELDAAIAPLGEFVAELIAACRALGLVASPLNDAQLGELAVRVFNERMLRRWLAAPDGGAPELGGADEALEFVVGAICGPVSAARRAG